MEVLKKYFPDMEPWQHEKFEEFIPLFKEWNEKINLVSRKDIDQLHIHHILHSLSIAKYIDFRPETKVLDLGTGGGFPGIPLAIMFPEVHFSLVDSIGKKIMVVQDIIEKLNIGNATAINGRAEELKERYHFVVTRAVAPADQLIRWSRKLFTEQELNATPNGIIALKGGNIKAEIKLIGKGEFVETIPIKKYFQYEYFEEKYLMYIQA
jgi:16S rRNA (guanine527-N7)-methyltransferase